jgi:hypothetical protein
MRDEEKGGLQGGGGKTFAARHYTPCAHLSLPMYLHTSYLHERLFHMQIERTVGESAKGCIIVLILIEICILFADPHTYLCAAPNKYTIKLPPRWVLRRALFFAPFLLSFRPTRCPLSRIYFHWPNGM